MLAPAGFAGAQDLASLSPAEQLRAIEPIMTEAERAAMVGLAGEEARAFVQRFWEARDLTPGTVANEARDIFEARLQRAGERFGGDGGPGYATDRGRVLLVFGLPDEQEMRAVPSWNPPVLTWRYNRYAPAIAVAFTRQEDGEYAVDETLELTSERFLNSLRDELRLILANTVGERHGALASATTPTPGRAATTEPGTSGAESDTAAGSDSGADADAPTPAGPSPVADPAAPAVAPEVQIWMELVFAGTARDEIGLDRDLFFFPATEGTYTVLSFEVGEEALEFVERDATAPPTAPGATLTPEQVARQQAASDAAAAGGMGNVADLRIFGAFLQGARGEENTIHSFIVPHRLEEQREGEPRPAALSLGVTLYPGEYRLAWGVLDATTGMAVTRDENIVVPDYSTGGLTLTRALLATAGLRDDTRPMNTTTVYEGVRLGNVLAANNVGDRYERDDTVEVVVVVSGWGSDPAAPGRPRLEVEYRVLAGLEGDESIARLPSQVLDFHVLGQQIPLAQVDRLRPGRDYRIEIRVKDLVSGEEAVERVPIYLRAADEDAPQ
jgi:GWxTD domain-containing protein